MESVYYNPEEKNLRIVGQLDEPDMSYEFHMLVVWEDIKTLEMYWAEDSGCSCPTPFEEHTDTSTLSLLNNSTFRDFEKDVYNFSMGYSGYHPEIEYGPKKFPVDALSADRVELLGKVSKNLRTQKLRRNEPVMKF